MDANTFNTIQDKLRRQVEASSQAGVDVPIDWPTTKGVKIHPPGAKISAQRADFQTTVDTLRQRSAQTQVGTRQSRPYEQQVPTANPLPGVDPVRYQQWMQSLQATMDMLNQLSQQQQQAIADMQWIQAQLADLEPAWVAHYGEPLQYPALLFDRAAVVNAACDAAGNIVLSHRPVASLQSAHRAQPLANHHRRTHKAVSGRRLFGWSSGLGVELKTLCQEPLQGLRPLYLRLGRALSLGRQGHTNAQVRQGGSSSRPLTVLEAVIWVGGGVIARVALNLLLAAFPFLWIAAVIGITAATAYALYQATLAVKPDLAIASRLLLALGGLVVGGGFGG